MMKNSIKKVGTTFLGLSCLLGGVLAFTGCESYEEFQARTTKESVSGINYYALSNEVEAQIKLTQTYNVDTVKLYKACLEMIKKDKEFTNKQFAKRLEDWMSWKHEWKVTDSDKPSEAGESGYISLKEDSARVSRCYRLQAGTTEAYVWGIVEYAPTLYIEKGTSKNTSILTIKPGWSSYLKESHKGIYSTADYQGVCEYYINVFKYCLTNAIFEGVQECIR